MRSFTDTVFALPLKPRTALVTRDAEGWSEALATMGIRPVEDAAAESGPPDLVVAPAERIGAALRQAPPCLIVEGRRAGRGLRRRGYAVRRFLPLPDPVSPRVLLPLAKRQQLRYAVDRSPPSVAWKRLRNRLAIPLLAAGFPPPGRQLVAIGSRERGPPFLVAEASRRFELPLSPEWLLVPASGDALSRGTFHLFPPGQEDPEWVLKFARVPGYSESFDREERGLSLAAAAGGEVTRHAPRLIGRFTFEGLHASVESAALGQSLVGYLGSAASARDKLAAIDRIAGWAVAIARSTASEPDRLATERVRIRTEVLPRWTEYGASSAILDQVPPVPGVLQHNDLGSWNVVVDACDASRPSFTALDWESARPVGMPLWDLWYFLQDALACLDGVSGLSENDLARREAHAVRLFRGELQNSKILFEWTRRGVVACGIPDRAVGTLATLCFLDHGLSQSNREDAARRHGSQARALDMLWPSLARRWLDDPALGPGWDRWR